MTLTISYCFLNKILAKITSAVSLDLPAVPHRIRDDGDILNLHPDISAVGHQHGAALPADPTHQDSRAELQTTFQVQTTLPAMVPHCSQLRAPSLPSPGLLHSVLGCGFPSNTETCSVVGSE